MKKFISSLLCLLILPAVIFSGNPVIQNRGVNDPPIRIIDGKAYLAASHDKSIENTRFRIDDWWLWSSDDKPF